MNRELVFANSDSLGRRTPVDLVRCITRILPCVEGGWRHASFGNAGCFRKAGRKQAGFGQPRSYADIGEALSVLPSSFDSCTERPMAPTPRTSRQK